ncbi:MAG: molybdopterin-binding protein [Candidatus Heimdallarchaeota archaeon]
MNSVTCLLLSIGNELVLGKTINSNASFLADQLTRIGTVVTKIVTIPDDEKMVVKEINQALKENYRIIIVTGGLGPTWDDSTAAFLAKALNVRMVLDSKALEMVTKRYQELYDLDLVKTAEITEARRKMAFLPEGTKPVENSIGTAPGIFYEHHTFNTCIYCLPGVPREMEVMYTIIEPHIITLIKAQDAHYFEINYTTSFTDESLLAPFLEKVREKYDVWIKSFPTSGAIKLIISKSGQESVRKEVEDAKLYLDNLIDDKNRTAH